MVIYKWKNTVTGKVYIGQTIQDPNRRRLEHLAECRNGKGRKHKIYNAMRKHGEDNFVFEVIDSATTLEELNAKEKQYIEQYDSIKNGYNLRQGGDNKTHSEESIEKMRAAQRAAHARRRANGGDTFKKTRKTKGWKYKMSAEIKAKWPYCIGCRRQMSLGALTNHHKRSECGL